MNEEIKVSTFYITIGGDMDVGIRDEHFELSPDFIFEDNEQLEFFREKLRETFEETFDGPVNIETKEEIDRKEKEIEEAMLNAAKADENFE